MNLLEITHQKLKTQSIQLRTAHFPREQNRTEPDRTACLSLMFLSQVCLSQVCLSHLERALRQFTHSVGRPRHDGSSSLFQVTKLRKTQTWFRNPSLSLVTVELPAALVRTSVPRLRAETFRDSAADRLLGGVVRTRTPRRRRRAGPVT